MRSKQDGGTSEFNRALAAGQLTYMLMMRHEDQRADALFRSAVSTFAALPANASLGYAVICLRYAKLKARHKDWREAASYLERGIKIESDVIPQSIAMAEACELSAQI